MTVRAAWLTETGQTREDTRLALSALLTPSAYTAASVPLQARGGVLPGSLELTGTGMKATIATGRAILQGATSQGAYMVAVTEAETLTITDGDAQYGRIDLIELVVQDNPYDGTGATRAILRLVKGTPAASPTAPASPNGLAMPLYRVAVPAGTSAGTGGIAWSTAVTNLRYQTAALGGIVPATGFDGAYKGQYRDSGTALERWDGTGWSAYPAALGGIAPNGAVSTAGYTGQYRDGSDGLLQRWNGSAWVSYQQVPTWTDYTPVWYTASGPAPVLGNGILNGRYCKIGTVVHVRARLAIGTTTNLSALDSTAGWSISMPVFPNTGWQGDILLNVVGYSSSGFRFFQGTAQIGGGFGGVAERFTVTSGTAASSWSKTVPYTWQATDVLSISGTYESAT